MAGELQLNEVKGVSIESVAYAMLGALRENRAFSVTGSFYIEQF
jgi:hypothetical protein